MRERGGVWIAHGAGPADHLVVDAHDKVAVPPEKPTYQLRRLWLEEPTFSAYYGGFANEGLWPLCHVVDVRPKFRSEDWAAYQEINQRFAAATHAELGASESPVFIQDYHLALVAPALRALRPDARTALFWHIPWPYPDRLRICPWRRETGGGAARQRPDRVPGGARPAQLPDGGRGGTAGRRRGRGLARALQRAHQHGRVGADRRGLRSHPGLRRRPGAAGRAAAPVRSCSTCGPRSSGSASIGSTTPRASPNGSTRSTR